MISNLDRYKKDLNKLISHGGQLQNAMQLECYPEEFEAALKEALKGKKQIDEIKKKLPSFREQYQNWYSESLAIIKFLLPDRVNDFVKLYEKPKGRKNVDYGNYVVEDYLQGLRVATPFGEVKVDPKAAIPQFQQQLNILRSAQGRFESSLFEIRQVLRADLFDSELEAAKELNNKGFTRGAGAMAGVVLEAHLSQVCENHKIGIAKKDPSISDLNDFLKNRGIYEVPTWRFIQHLGDLRNKCDHKKSTEPTKQEIVELIEGVEKITKLVF